MVEQTVTIERMHDKNRKNKREERVREGRTKTDKSTINQCSTIPVFETTNLLINPCSDPQYLKYSVVSTADHVGMQPICVYVYVYVCRRVHRTQVIVIRACKCYVKCV